MSRPVRRALGAIVVACVMSFAAVTPSTAGSSRPAHSARAVDAAALVGFYRDGQRYRCSATLASRTILITAAHCLSDVAGALAVSFDAFARDPLPGALDGWVGYTADEITATGWSSGQAQVHPGFSGAPGEASRHSEQAESTLLVDVGVIVLDEPEDGIEPAVIAPLRYLLEAGGPKESEPPDVSGVRHELTAGKGPASHTDAMTVRDVSDISDDVVLALARSAPDSTRSSGAGRSAALSPACQVDTGGPILAGGFLVGVPSYASHGSCVADVAQRLDTPAVQEWLASFALTFG